MFLFERDLVSAEMERVNRQLRLLEGLAGTNPNKLDSHLHTRLKDELATATLMRLEDTGLLGKWMQSWDLREAGRANLSPEPNRAPNSGPRAAIHLVLR